MDYTIGVDIGGTFTDCVVLDEEGFLVVGNALSTPRDFSIGALAAVRDAAQNLGSREARLIKVRPDFSFMPARPATIPSSRARAPRPGSSPPEGSATSS
jgi:hypothetical protein